MLIVIFCITSDIFIVIRRDHKGLKYDLQKSIRGVPATLINIAKVDSNLWDHTTIIPYLVYNRHLWLTTNNEISRVNWKKIEFAHFTLCQGFINYGFRKQGPKRPKASSVCLVVYAFGARITRMLKLRADQFF